MDHVDAFKERGYAVVAAVFSPAEIAELAAEIDRLREAGLKHASSFRDGNVMYLIREDARLGRVLRYMQWPSYVSPVMARYRTDRRLLGLVRPLIGEDLKQIINQIIWKAPGAVDGTYGYHQDVRFRRPASAYRDLATSYVQTAIAIDPHRSDNGCMRVLPGSHRLGVIGLPVDKGVIDQDIDDATLRRTGLDPAAVVDLRLEPGDVAMWGPYLVHGSAPNRSRIDRRTYVNGYVVAANCDRGEWAFRNGAPCELGAPVLVQHDDLYDRPGPHYFEGDPHPFRGE
jgi:ectoine hydroxylase-related dioxygenase (phytanoyl-CoA dioxygenase family)